MDDEELLQLIEEVRHYPTGSHMRQKSMEGLLITIMQLPGLIKSSHPEYLSALNQTWEWVWCNIDNFSPRPPSVQQSLVNWVNGYLKWRLLDAKKLTYFKHYSLDEPVSNYGEQTLLEQISETGLGIPTYSGLEEYIQQVEKQEVEQIGLAIETVIKQDLDSRLESLHIRGCNECNCKFLSQKLLLQDPPETLASLTQYLSQVRLARNLPIISYQTLVSHWKRKCLPCLRAIAIELDNTRVLTSLYLVVALTRVTLQEIGIMVGIHPISGQLYLPAQLKLMVLNSDDISVMEATTTDTNKNIKLYFSGVTGERFSVKIVLDNALVTENFVI